MDYQNLDEKLRMLRKNKGVSQDQITIKIGKTRELFSSAELIIVSLLTRI